MPQSYMPIHFYSTVFGLFPFFEEEEGNVILWQSTAYTPAKESSEFVSNSFQENVSKTHNIQTECSFYSEQVQISTKPQAGKKSTNLSSKAKFQVLCRRVEWISTQIQTNIYLFIYFVFLTIYPE